MGTYRLLQITNLDGMKKLETDDFLPLGKITRKISYSKNDSTFDVSYSGADTVTINETGYYKITYNATIKAAEEGDLGIALIVNGEKVYEVGEQAGVEEIRNLTIPFVIRVFKKCNDLATNNPTTIRLQLIGVPISDGESNLIIERVY